MRSDATGDDDASVLTRAAREIGCPWYVDILAECDEEKVRALELEAFRVVDDPSDERFVTSWRNRLRTLLEDECGASRTDAEALMEQVLSSARARAVRGGERDVDAAQTSSHGDARDVIRRTSGGNYDEVFLELVEPLYDLHMGAENMGPLLYALCRFVKPKRVLEVGAGYTSVFLLQALVDNAREISTYRELIERGAARLGNVPWAAHDFDFSANSHKLHIVDNCAHEHTTAHKVADIAEALGCRELLEVHIKDAFDSELPSTLALPEVKYFDLLWIDLGAANRIEGFFDAWWHRVNPQGGFVIVHSTLTNSLSRQWLDKMRRLAENGGRNSEDGSSPYGAFVTVSFLEPHKMFQNSCSLFQKRGDALHETWTERVLTKYP